MHRHQHLHRTRHLDRNRGRRLRDHLRHCQFRQGMLQPLLQRRPELRRMVVRRYQQIHALHQGHGHQGRGKLQQAVSKGQSGRDLLRPECRQKGRWRSWTVQRRRPNSALEGIWPPALHWFRMHLPIPRASTRARYRISQEHRNRNPTSSRQPPSRSSQPSVLFQQLGEGSPTSESGWSELVLVHR